MFNSWLKLKLRDAAAHTLCWGLNGSVSGPTVGPETATVLQANEQYCC